MTTEMNARKNAFDAEQILVFIVGPVARGTTRVKIAGGRRMDIAMRQRLKTS